MWEVLLLVCVAALLLFVSAVAAFVVSGWIDAACQEGSRADRLRAVIEERESIAEWLAENAADKKAKIEAASEDERVVLSAVVVALESAVEMMAVRTKEMRRAGDC